MEKIKQQYVIGIDPGVNTGFVIYDREKKELTDLATHDFWTVYLILKQLADYKLADQHLVIIETPNSKRPMYARVDNNSYEGRVRESMATRIGSNRREADLLATGIELLGFEVRRVQPTRTKWTAQQLLRYTGLTIRTNEHTRDAIALVWGI